MLARTRGAGPVLLLVPLVLALPVRARSQLVTGRALGAEDGRPLVAAMVLLLDDAGAVRERTLTDATGAFRIRAPSAGTYHVRVELIGYEATESEAVDVAAGRAAQLEIRASPEALLLEGFDVQADNRCRVRPSSGEITARLWEEVRRALEMARWGEQEGLLRLRVARWDRKLDPERLTVLDEQRRVDTRFTTSSPFASVPAAELEELGYVREQADGSYRYFGPDANVLLSDLFLDGHCFRVRTEDPPEPGWVGLAFEPVRRAGVADVEGVLWVDAATRELQRLEFGYTRLPAGLQDDRVGGQVVFERIPEGPWIVRRWAIRMPEVGLRRSYDLGGGSHEETFLMGLTETGGEVLQASLPDGSPLSRARTATLVGTVFDSVAGAPLAGATVRLAGTAFSATTDSAGRFRLDGLPDGSYGVVFHATRLKDLPWVPVAVPVELRAGSTAEVSLAIPPRERVLAEGCQGMATDDGTAVVTGRATAEGNDDIPEGAEVMVAWKAFELVRGQEEGTTVGQRDNSARVPLRADGSFAVCGLPHRTTLTVQVEVAELAGPPVTLTLAFEEMRGIQVVVPKGGGTR